MNAVFARQIYKPKLEAVCRAGWRGERNRGAVRMTATGSVTPGMACGSRPVERAPEPGFFPTVGINRRPGIAKGEGFSPLTRPRQRQVGQSPQPTGRNRPIRNRPIRNRPPRNRPIGGMADRSRPVASTGQRAGRPGPITCKTTLHIPRFTAPARRRIVNVLIKMLWET